MVDIRKIRTGDTDRVKDLINSIMEGEFSQENSAYAYQDLDDLPKHYGGDREMFLVAEKSGEIVGTVAIKEDGPDTALLRRVFVDPKHRGQGYGSKLLNKAMAFCLDQNYKTVMFRGTDRMQTALQLCLRNGFEEDDISALSEFKLFILKKNLEPEA